MIDQLQELIREHFWYNTGPVVFTWGTAVVREGLVRFVVAGLSLGWAVAAAAYAVGLWGNPKRR